MNLIFGQDTAAVGNGGGADAAANGGAISLGDINSGANAGSAIAVGDTAGGMICDDWGKCVPAGDGFVDVNGGSAANTTGIALATDGGTAIANVAGGNNNVAFVS